MRGEGRAASTKDTGGFDHRRTMAFLDPRAVAEACLKVGQTFLSALLVFTQHFVRLPLSSQERGPAGEVLLPEC